MLRILGALLPTLYSSLRCRRDLLLENLALRQQLATLVVRRRPSIRPADRAFWVLLCRLWPGWALNYYHLDRTHLGLDKDSPLGRPVEPRPHALATVAALPRVEGLHRRYYWRQAA